ncbi:MAG: O-antigen ligase family protein [Candidatus Aminicenantes bacterium]|nr:O-antigen ligase family protein [Candidatus Aminicenantes bacterium]
MAGSKDKVYAGIIDYGLLGLIIFTPLPAASVYEWSVLVIQLVVLIMLAAHILMKEKPAVNPSLAPVIKRLKVIYLIFIAFIFIQLIPLPIWLVRILSPSAHHYRRLYTVDFSGTEWMSLSLIPAHTLQKGLELLAYFLLGFLVLKTIGRRHQIFRLWTVLISVGVLEALYGLFELYNKNPRILFYRKIHNLDSVTGTFVNRNHLSGYLEMIIPLAIGLLIARTDIFSYSRRTLRERLIGLQEKGFTRNLIVFIAIVVMAIAVIFSKSRSGLFVLLLTFVLFFGLVTIYFDIYPLQKKWIKRILKIAFLAIISISFYFGMSATLERFSLDRILQEERPTYWAHSLKTTSDYPLVGTGLGTFGALAPNLEGEAGPVAMVHAHNDYLEFLFELGIIGFLLLFGGIFYALIISFLTWGKRKRPEVKGLALGGIVSLICILTHSLTDFNLHIPANMVLFSVVLPLTLVVAFYKQGTNSLKRQ